MSLRIILAATAFAVAPVIVAPIAAADAPAATYTKKDNIAVSGYDPVAYFTEGAPTKGSASFTSTYKGATYRFASADNKATFDADPVKYAPQYGGYCAYAVAKGQTARGNPKNWTVADGKLYLNYNSGIQKRWKKKQASYIVDANTNWPGIIGESSEASSHEGGYGS